MAFDSLKLHEEVCSTEDKSSEDLLKASKGDIEKKKLLIKGEVEGWSNDIGDLKEELSIEENKALNDLSKYEKGLEKCGEENKAEVEACICNTQVGLKSIMSEFSVDLEGMGSILDVSKEFPGIKGIQSKLGNLSGAGGDKLREDVYNIFAKNGDAVKKYLSEYKAKTGEDYDISGKSIVDFIEDISGNNPITVPVKKNDEKADSGTGLTGDKDSSGDDFTETVLGDNVEKSGEKNESIAEQLEKEPEALKKCRELYLKFQAINLKLSKGTFEFNAETGETIDRDITQLEAYMTDVFTNHPNNTAGLEAMYEEIIMISETYNANAKEETDNINEVTLLNSQLLGEDYLRKNEIDIGRIDKSSKSQTKVMIQKEKLKIAERKKDFLKKANIIKQLEGSGTEGTELNNLLKDLLAASEPESKVVITGDIKEYCNERLSTKFLKKQLDSALLKDGLKKDPKTGNIMPVDDISELSKTTEQIGGIEGAGEGVSNHVMDVAGSVGVIVPREVPKLTNYRRTYAGLKAVLGTSRLKQMGYVSPDKIVQNYKKRYLTVKPNIVNAVVETSKLKQKGDRGEFTAYSEKHDAIIAVKKGKYGQDTFGVQAAADSNLTVGFASPRVDDEKYQNIVSEGEKHIAPLDDIVNENERKIFELEMKKNSGEPYDENELNREIERLKVDINDAKIEIAIKMKSIQEKVKEFVVSVNEDAIKLSKRSAIFLRSVGFDLLPISYRESILSRLQGGFSHNISLGDGFNLNGKNIDFSKGRYGEKITEDGSAGELLFVKLMNKVVTGNPEGIINGDESNRFLNEENYYLANVDDNLEGGIGIRGGYNEASMRLKMKDAGIGGLIFDVEKADKNLFGVENTEESE